jgi:hypothetical protein
MLLLFVSRFRRFTAGVDVWGAVPTAAGCALLFVSFSILYTPQRLNLALLRADPEP